MTCEVTYCVTVTLQIMWITVLPWKNRKQFGRGLRFLQLTSSKITRIIIGQFTHNSALQNPNPPVVHVCKQLLYHDQVRRSSASTGFAKWKSIIMGRDGTRGCCVRKTLHRQIFSVSCLQFVDRKYLHVALCSAGYGTSAVARKVHRWLSVGGIATPLKNGSVRSSGRFQGDDGEVLRRKGICGANSCLVSA